MIKPRHKAFLEALPRNRNKIKPSAIEAGYSPIYADKQGKTLLRNAVKAQAKDIVKQVENKEISPIEAKRYMYELVGFSRENVFDRLKFIANQDKDLASALKVLAPLAKELGVILKEDDEHKTIVPILNIGVEKVDTTKKSEDIKDIVGGE